MGEKKKSGGKKEGPCRRPASYLLSPIPDDQRKGGEKGKKGGEEKVRCGS